MWHSELIFVKCDVVNSDTWTWRFLVRHLFLWWVCDGQTLPVIVFVLSLRRTFTFLGKEKYYYPGPISADRLLAIEKELLLVALGGNYCLRADRLYLFIVPFQFDGCVPEFRLEMSLHALTFCTITGQWAWRISWKKGAENGKGCGGWDPKAIWLMGNFCYNLLHL